MFDFNMSHNFFCCLLLLMFSFGSIAESSDYSAGRKEALAGNYSEAINIWEKLVPEGNVQAIYSLAQIYQNGLGVIKDYEKARSLFHLAALLEYPDAQYALGAHYFSLIDANFYGEDDDPESTQRQNIIKGYTWLSFAAKNGHAEARNLLEKIEHAGIPGKLVVDAQRWAKDCENNLISC